MKMIVDVPGGFLDRIKELVQIGHYSSIEEFLELAIMNQIKLEADTNIINNRILLSPFNQQTNIIHFDKKLQLKEKYDIEEIMAPEDDEIEGNLLWGQYNRLLPVKFVVRYLANYLNENKKLANLDEFSEEASEHARRFGLQLLDVDKTKKRIKGEKISTAFPIGNDPYKSKLRFKNHFVGYMDTSGKIIGAPAQLKFIKIINDGSKKIGLTKFGAEFAKILNPVLDENIENENPFSADEIEFYITHLKNNLINEYGAIIFLLNQIKNGITRPNELTEKVILYDDNITKSQADIMRGGLVSRMSELGLINSIRVGMRGISYELAPHGMTLINAHGNGGH